MGNYFSTSSDSRAAITQTPLPKYGWKRGRADPRDWWFNASFVVPEDVTIDLREQCPPVYDQGKLGSCTANAIAFCYEFCLKKQRDSEFVPSRLFIYWNERDMEHHTTTDSGAEIRDGIKSIHQLGVCPEAEWPYNITKFADKPNDKCYADALSNRTISYRRVRQVKQDILVALSAGYPIAFGFLVYPSFEQHAGQAGVMPLPSPSEKPLGGHAVAVVGYDVATQTFIVRNSWGSEWGDAGYFYMPESFLLDPSQCSDFWTVSRVDDTQGENQV